MRTKCLIILAILFNIIVLGPARAFEIPDSNLRRAIYVALDLDPQIHITAAHLKLLTRLDAENHSIANLTGIELATELEELGLNHNFIADLRPIAGLVKLTVLRLTGNLIVDLTPLTNLTRLKYLYLEENQITDVTPLANLTRLVALHVDRNLILDHQPLDNLSLIYFTYDQPCELPPIPLAPRLAARDYPLISTSFGIPLSNRPELSLTENIAQHDLIFSGTEQFGLSFRETPLGFTVAGRNAEHLDDAIKLRNEHLAVNPNMIFTVEIRMRSLSREEYPDNWPYWLRDENDNIVPATTRNYGVMNFTLPDVQDRIVQQAIAVAKCGLYDGIMFDHWNEYGPILRDVSISNEIEQRARDNIVARIRAAVRPNFIIIGNTNLRKMPRTAPYINGGSMESVFPGNRNVENLKRTLPLIESTLLWLDTNIRQPRLNIFEGRTIPTEPFDSPSNLRWVRALTTLTLTHSDGYLTFNDERPTRWYHWWYDFWDADLGRPVGPKSQLYQDIDGLYIREFTNGWAVYNHSGEAQVITLPEEVQGVASGLVGTEHTLPNLDGEMYLRVKPKNPADVNGDGVVNILDLVMVAQGLGTDSLEGDVNGDGTVNVLDLVQVAGAIGEGAAAPSAYSLTPSMISAADVKRWLAQAQGSGIGDANFQRGIRFLQQLLAALTPKETSLLPNYPNPFNPETWIPYRLAQEAEVAITIYDTKGTLVRQLALGNQAAGYYAARGKAAYWDGRNERGEAVASGIYFYQFRAGDYVASRRLVILK